MDYKKAETEIIEATKEFATINNIHYDELTESMILNAMRELNKSWIADVTEQSEQLIKAMEEADTQRKCHESACKSEVKLHEENRELKQELEDAKSQNNRHLANFERLRDWLLKRANKCINQSKESEITEVRLTKAGKKSAFVEAATRINQRYLNQEK